MENQGQKATNRVGKYSFVNRTVADWNRLHEEVIGDYHGKLHILRKRIRKVKGNDGDK